MAFNCWRSKLRSCLAACLVLVGIADLALAQDRANVRQQANENVVTIISGNPNGGFLYTAYDIAAVLEKNSDLRVLPIVGKGGAQNIKDILYLRGIDMGIVHPHLVDYYNKNGELGANVSRRIAYITPLFADELHAVAAKNIKSFRDLEGKRVNISDKGSGTALTMEIIFKLLGMKVKIFNMGQTDAFEMIKQGKLDATMCTCAKPLRSVRGIGPNDGLKLLSVPYTEELEELFIPGVITHNDYPQIVPKGQTVETIAVQTALGVFNWSRTNPRYAPLKKFVEALFTNIAQFHRPPRSPKWRSLNIAAKIKSMQRFSAAQEWLDKNAPKPAAAAPGTITVDPALARKQAQAAAPNDPVMQERLFKEFMQWMERKQQSGQAN